MTREEEIQKAASEYIDELSEKEIDYTQIDYEETTYEAGRCNAISKFGKAIFKAGVEWADKGNTKSEDNVTLSFHVCDIPCPEEVMAGANAKYEAYFVSVPKNLIPKKLLEVITKDSNHKYISQVALLKDGLV